MAYLEIEQSGSYRDGRLDFSIKEKSLILIPEEIFQKENTYGTVGFISHEMSPEYYGTLELNSVFPLEWARKSTGLGSFIISQTLSKIYNDSFNSQEVSPDTNIIVNTKTPELIKILENRTFQEGIFGHMTTIQNAGEKSEQIMLERNWM